MWIFWIKKGALLRDGCASIRNRGDEDSVPRVQGLHLIGAGYAVRLDIKGRDRELEDAAICENPEVPPDAD